MTINIEPRAPNSRLTFWASGRRRRLYRKKPLGHFYIRFQHNGKDVPRCLGTTDVKLAIEKAKRLIKATYAGGEAALQALLDRERVTVCPLPKAIEQAIRIPLVRTPAVYFLLQAGSVKYVGQSRNIFSRIGSHVQNKLGFDEIAYVPVLLEKLLDEEARYIRLFKPSLNKKSGQPFRSAFVARLDELVAQERLLTSGENLNESENTGGFPETKAASKA